MAAPALPGALVRPLVDAHGPVAVLAAECLVAALGRVVAELEVLGRRGDELLRLLRLQVIARLDLLLVRREEGQAKKAWNR